jgi:hypothetical protein
MTPTSLGACSSSGIMTSAGMCFTAPPSGGDPIKARRGECPTWSAPIVPAARLRRSANAPPAGGVFQEIGGAGNAFGGFGHLGGDLTGSSDVLRREDGAQVRHQCFLGGGREVPRGADLRRLRHR